MPNVVPAPCDFITGGGWVIGDSAQFVNFGAHGGCKHGAFWGHVNVVGSVLRASGERREWASPIGAWGPVGSSTQWED